MLWLFALWFNFKKAKLVLGTSTACSKIRSARSKICPLEERSCSKCSKKISLGFRSARYVLEKSCARARSARIFYARNARKALGIEHKKSIILDELLIVCSEYFFKIVPGQHRYFLGSIISSSSLKTVRLFEKNLLWMCENRYKINIHKV